MRSILLFVLTLLVCFNVYADQTPTVWLSGGVDVSNSINDEKSRAWGVEQETQTSFGLMQFGYVNEGHKPIDKRKRDGIYALWKASYDITRHIETAFSVGPYSASVTIPAEDCVHYRDAYDMTLMASLGIRYTFDKHWGAQARWSHVLLTQGNNDADILAVGLSYRPDWGVSSSEKQKASHKTRLFSI